MKYDICIIGAGRVGLPFALMLENKCGFKVGVLDINPETISKINTRIMPFEEPGFDKLLQASKIYASHLPNAVDADTFVITVGTPLKQHIEADLTAVFTVIDTLLNTVGIKDKLLILRSTLAPNTTSTIEKYITKKSGLALGLDYYMAMCPERIAEGKAFEEYTSLPQIIGAEDKGSMERAAAIFTGLGVKLFQVDTFVEAELTKLFCNIYRYINFSVPNYFMYIMNHFGVKDMHNLLRCMNTDYPRNKGMAYPGFTAGTCLRKDFGMLNEFFPQTDIILQSYKINEFMPKFVVDAVKDQINCKRVGVLGYTFKRDTDDTRDTLSYKMINYINRCIPSDVFISERWLGQSGVTYNDVFNDFKFINYTEDEIFSKSSIIFIGTNHSHYYSEEFRTKLRAFITNGGIVVDIWNLIGDGKLVYGDKK